MGLAVLPPPPPPPSVVVCAPAVCCVSRMQLARCGDMHPHRVPLQMAVSNFIMLRPQCHTTFAWEADVILLGEM